MNAAERERIRELARRAAEAAPPLRAEQRDRLSGLLRPAPKRRAVA